MGLWHGRTGSTRGGKGDRMGVPPCWRRESAPDGEGVRRWMHGATSVACGRCGRRPMACVQEAVRQSVPLGPCDPPARHRFDSTWQAKG